ncbi:MAG: AI-2E family transporter [Bacteroidales bacterium]|jgi:predicted PurR-regulated permease PerM|nr:AI-2E family transporter [Bacteroidales bacterium]
MNNQLYQYIKPLVAFGILVFMTWYFSDVVVCILVAIFLSMIGAPLAKYMNTWHIGKYTMPHGASAMLTMVLFLFLFGLFLLIIAPMILNQAYLIKSIKIDDIVVHFKDPMRNLDAFLVQYNIIKPGETFTRFIQLQVHDLVDMTRFRQHFTNIISATGTLVFGVFIILFLTYYFLLDDGLIKNFMLILSPDKYVDDISQVLHDSKFLLVRYFHGILTEVIIMISLETIGLLILGIPNAVLIGFIGGLMNVIPYLGPAIGMCLGIILGLLSELGAKNYDMLTYVVLGVMGVFAGAKVIDDLVLQPLIYSRSVKAHPVEVFLAIIIGGKLAGIIGMILAIPIYTILRVVLRQFLNQMKLVKYLTSRM